MNKTSKYSNHTGPVHNIYIKTLKGSLTIFISFQGRIYYLKFLKVLIVLGNRKEGRKSVP